MNFNLEETVDDGNCFFDSLRIILSSLNYNFSILKLREICYKPFLDKKDENANKTIDYWLTLYKEADIDTKKDQ